MPENIKQETKLKFEHKSIYFYTLSNTSNGLQVSFKHWEGQFGNTSPLAYLKTGYKAMPWFQQKNDNCWNGITDIYY